MPARSKKRAKFNFQGRNFLWHVDADTWLRICSADKQFIVAYLLYHPSLNLDSPMYIEIIGTDFPPASVHDRPLRLVVPSCVADEIQNSMGALVNAILEWAFNPATEIEYHPLAKQLTSA